MKKILKWTNKRDKMRDKINKRTNGQKKEERKESRKLIVINCFHREFTNILFWSKNDFLLLNCNCHQNCFANVVINTIGPY